MAKNKKDAYDPLWAEAKKKCRLNQDDIAMAKQLGFKPKTLLKNIPSPKEQWKAPVKQWIRDLYYEKYGTLINTAGGKDKPNTLDDDLPF